MRHSLVRRAAAGSIVAATALSLVGCNIPSDPHADNTVVVTQVNLGGCAAAAPAPQPGWVNCNGSMVVFVSMAVTSGWVSVRMPFPQPNSVYGGEVQVTKQRPGDLIIGLTNPYEPSCVTSYDTKISVYDGRLNDPNAKLLKSIPFTIKFTCGSMVGN